ncbi:transposable element Tcb2 transposase [Trichonephila clavipes]|nr:transposable element Tcb2 transposase [Trichonephila clavipes]
MSTISQRSHLTDSEAWRGVGKIWNRFLEAESAGRRQGQGSRRATMPNEDRYLKLMARRHRNMNATLLPHFPTTPSLGYWHHGFNSDCPKLASWCRRIFIWRDRGSRNNPAFVHESVRFVGGAVLVDEIIRPIVVPYAAAIGEDFILMDENSSPHRANLVEDSLFEEGIIRMEWSACSPDMNQ